MDKDYLKMFGKNLLTIGIGILAFFSMGKASQNLGYEFIYGPMALMVVGLFFSVFMLSVSQVDSKRREAEHEKRMAQQKAERKKSWKEA